MRTWTRALWLSPTPRPRRPLQVYWLEQTAAAAPPGDEWLSEDERGVLAELRIPKRRADWRLGRWTAKRAVAAFLGLEAGGLSTVEVRPAPSGAPRAFTSGRPAAVSMSLSHSQGVAFCAVAEAGAAIGCDVEKIEPRSPAFLRDYFTEEEQAKIEACAAPDRDAFTTLFWSAKESVLKALECGLRADPTSIAVTPAWPAAHDWTPFAASAFGDSAFTGWWRIARDFVWTIAAPSYSRNAFIGPSRAARRAGIQAATIAVTASTTGTTT